MSTATTLRCEPCDRVFTRREHLERHRLTHSGEKRFTCSVCGKRYARRDVYHRHLRGHGESAPMEALERRSVHAACDVCRRRKVKCPSSERPCPRCRAAGVVCTFNRPQVSSATSLAISPNAAFPSSVERDSAGNAEDSASPQLLVDAYLSNGRDVGALETSHGDDGAFDDNLSLLSAAADVQQITAHDLMGFDLFSTPVDYSLWDPLLQNGEDIFESFAYSFDAVPFDHEPVTSQAYLLQPAGEATTYDRTHDYRSRQRERLATAYGKLYEYTNTSHPTRPPSPTSASAQREYVSELGNTEPSTFDRVIVNVFVGLFQTHVAPTFPCFQNFRITASTYDEVYLAMAAVGGLYCRAPKAELVSKWMFHTARRQLFTVEHGRVTPDAPRRLGVLQSYILIEIFAYICGDGRVTLLLEVFHNQAVQAFRAFDWNCLGEEYPESVRSNLLYALSVLECYRVVLLQRPSVLYPFSALEGLPAPHRPGERSVTRQSTSIILCSLLSCDGPSIRIDSLACSMESFCALSLLVSHSDRLPGSLRRNPRAGHSSFRISSNGWRQELLELALHRWLSSHSAPPSASTMMLYHLCHLSMYSNFPRICRVARSKFAQQRTANRDHGSARADGGQYTDRGQETNLACSDHLESCFVSDEDQQKAMWHARSIFTLAQRTSPPADLNDGERIHLCQQSKTSREGEGVHYSHAIYYASMVFWSLDMLRSSSKQSKCGGNDRPLEIVQALQRGVSLLSRSTSRVADIYKHTLQSLGWAIEQTALST